MLVKIIYFVATVVLLGTALKLFGKKHFFFSGSFAVLAFLCFIGGFTKSLTDEQILCWAFGLAFFVFAGYMAHKDRLSYAFIAFIISVFACFCGLSGVQALLKTHLLWQVSTSLKSYGDKIDRYQTSVADMQQELMDQQIILSNNLWSLQESFRKTNFAVSLFIESNQMALKTAESNVISQQVDITNQFQQLTLVQSNLTVAQTNLLAQATKLSDVEYMVQHLYDLTTNETFRIGDTNNLQFYDPTNNIVRYIIRLSHIPIAGSIEKGLKDNVGGESKDYLTSLVSNIVGGMLVDYDTNTVVFTFHYVIDTRKTNFYKTMPVLNKDFILSSNNMFYLKPLN